MFPSGCHFSQLAPGANTRIRARLYRAARIGALARDEPFTPFLAGGCPALSQLRRGREMAQGQRGITKVTRREGKSHSAWMCLSASLETRNRKAEIRRSKNPAIFALVRISDFFRASDFGFRVF